jgi:hypothetical protein
MTDAMMLTMETSKCKPIVIINDEDDDNEESESGDDVMFVESEGGDHAIVTTVSGNAFPTTIAVDKNPVTRKEFREALRSLLISQYMWPTLVPAGNGAAVTACFSFYGIDQMRRHGHVNKDTLVIDIGMGPGTALLQMAATSGCAISGVDFKPELISIANTARDQLSSICPILDHCPTNFITRDVRVNTDQVALELLRPKPITARYFPASYAFPDLKYKSIVVLINNVRFWEDGPLGEAVYRMLHVFATTPVGDPAAKHTVPVTIYHTNGFMTQSQRHRRTESETFVNKHNSYHLAIDRPGKSFQGWGNTDKILVKTIYHLL